LQGSFAFQTKDVLEKECSIVRKVKLNYTSLVQVTCVTTKKKNNVVGRVAEVVECLHSKPLFP
jgi:hypothetical protein